MNVKQDVVDYISESFILIFSLPTHSKSPKPQKPREKQMRVWDMGGKSSTKDLDYTKNGDGSQNGGEHQEAQIDLVCTPTITLNPLEVSSYVC